MPLCSMVQSQCGRRAAAGAGVAIASSDAGTSRRQRSRNSTNCWPSTTVVLAHSALAVVYGKVNQHEKAIEHGVRASELEPDDSFSWTALSVTYQRAFAGTDEHKYIQMAEDAMAKSKMMTGH